MTHHELIEAVGANIEMFPALDEKSMKEILQGRNFSSGKEAIIFLNRHLRPKVSHQVVERHGLKVEQMERLLNRPFENDDSAVFLSSLDVQPQALVLEIFSLYVDAIGGKGLTVTKDGKLPPKFYRDAANHLDSIPYCRQQMNPELYSKSYDSAVHVTGVIAELAGLMDSDGGEYVLTDQFLRLMADQGQAGVYKHLFRVFVEDFSWSYSDRWQDIPLLQHSFLFTLYLLKKYGKEWRTTSFYLDNFLKTFPTILLEIKPVEHFFSPEDVLRYTYSLRCLDRFAHFFGLVEVERECWLKSRPLLDHVVQFSFESR